MMPKLKSTFLRLVLAIMHMGSINTTTKITRITRIPALNITAIEVTFIAELKCSHLVIGDLSWSE